MIRQRTTIAQYLIQRLQEVGVRHLFGVPGDYALQFYAMLEASPIQVVGTTREDCAGFAADAYARVNGVGAACVTYCVGGLSLCNAVAGAYAEKSPLVVISGAPGVSERTSSTLLHHCVRDFNTQHRVFQNLTIASAQLDNPRTAFAEIDRVLESARRYSRPVYLELPRDMVDVAGDESSDAKKPPHRSDRDSLDEAIEEATSLIRASRDPIILAGVEVPRFGIQRDLVRLAERYNIPIATTLLGKSAVCETHPLHIGIYAASVGRRDVRRRVESSDCLIMIGAFLTDIDAGITAPALDEERCIYATSERLQIRHHHFDSVILRDFVRGLARRAASPTGSVSRQAAKASKSHKSSSSKSLKLTHRGGAAAISVPRLFEHVDGFLTKNMIVIADIGDSLLGAIDLVTHRQTEFLGMAYYTSMGFAIPAALGAGLAEPKRRALVITGDGAFQMTGMELSTIVRHGLNPIVIVLNNGGYGTERLLHEGEFAFNDIQDWQYHRLPEILGGGQGFDVRTEAEFATALRLAKSNRESFSLLNVHLKRDDHSAALGRLAKRLSQRV